MPRRPTRDPHHRPAMQTLERLHSELGGQILENRHKHQELSDSMRHVEAVLKLIDPSYNLRPIAVKRRKTNQWFKRGTLYRRAVDAMRVAEKPMTATEIAWAVLKAAKIETDDNKAVGILGQGIQASLRNHEGKSVEVTNEGIPARWMLR